MHKKNIDKSKIHGIIKIIIKHPKEVMFLIWILSASVFMGLFGLIYEYLKGKKWNLK